MNIELAFLKDLLQRWDALNGSFPQNYVCFDMEGTGLKKSEDLIIELGSCRVKDCAAEEYESMLLDWTKTPYVDPDWLEVKLEGINKYLGYKSAAQTKFTVDKLRKEGVEPDTAFRSYVEILGKADWVIGHNIIGFDLPRFSFSVAEWLGYSFEVPEEKVIDTAAIEKAKQLRISPKKNESFYAFQKRVLNAFAGKGVRYSLINYVVPTYKLDEQYGLDMTKGHTAGFDAMLIHLFIEELRGLLSSKNVKPLKDSVGGDRPG